MGSFDGKVAFITGAARGQGRSHAIEFARRGTRVIAIDIDQQVPSAPYPTATAEDLAETVRLVEGLGGEILAATVDVRDLAGLSKVITNGVERFGRLDFILANAGIVSYGLLSSMDEDQFQEMIDINLTGVWKTVRAGVQHMVDAGNGGCIVLTSSTAGLRTMGNIGHYAASKHGVVALAKAFANELGPHHIRVNSVHPSNTRTVMGVDNDGVLNMFRPDLENPTLDDCVDAFASIHVMPDVPWIHPIDITNTVLFICSDEAKYMTGAQIPVDVGMLAKNP
ncbi:3-ketoacyl-ACP reductase [Mycobacterium dioxanotrophicus]|uniref:3-ketoacyl-ACP reductase n=1 Tax=Mycobacterium dioxanotrophicus TaxID=482462 RepID=A0A1Y0BZ97_9MYCO|nr:mycofactocin-coupled SDR family oxidoreductase [Mycobacterium dioxanotrophicus]ART68239.1 3-ketoacyl-ACP reductase [Mycobacterium dioxanotrophicus]